MTAQECVRHDGLGLVQLLRTGAVSTDLILQLSSQLEAAAPWAHRRPPIFDRPPA